MSDTSKMYILYLQWRLVTFTYLLIMAD